MGGGSKQWVLAKNGTLQWQLKFNITEYTQMGVKQTNLLIFQKQYIYVFSETTGNWSMLLINSAIPWLKKSDFT